MLLWELVAFYYWKIRPLILQFLLIANPFLTIIKQDRKYLRPYKNSRVNPQSQINGPNLNLR